METTMIGILAGMGPRATAPFVDLVVTQCQLQYGATYDVDFPPMMIYSLPTPIYLDRPLDHQRVQGTIIQGLQRLEKTGVDFIAMPCNTAHMYHQALAAALDVPLLNMIDATLDALPSGAQKVALLATRMTMGAGLYQPRLRQVGLEVVEREAWQEAVDDLIRTIKASPTPEAARAKWTCLTEAIAAEGVDTAILACTDLNAASSPSAPGLTVLDATQCLAVATVAAWRASVEPALT